MKKIFYHNQVAIVQLGETTFEAGIKEISVSLNPTADETEYTRFPASELKREDFQISFKTDLDKDFNLSKMFEIKPYRQITIEFRGYITEQQKQAFCELSEKGYLWFLQFRQRIYPKLIAEISFVTVFQAEAVWNDEEKENETKIE